MVNTLLNTCQTGTSVTGISNNSNFDFIMIKLISEILNRDR